MGQEITANQPRPINTWLESLTSQASSAQNEAPEVREVKAQKDDAILVLLAKLALVYWRPDFTPAQARELYSQYLDDLRDLPFVEIEQAVAKFRRDPENKFYPTPGQIRGLITAIPSWNVCSAKKWAKELREAAAAEIEKRVLALTHQKQKALTA